MAKFIIINGPNLNMLGVREPEIYGNQDFVSWFSELQKDFTEVSLNHFQSNCEGKIIDEIQKAGLNGYSGIILNAGAYSHYSLAIADAIRGVDIPVIEVHISNIFAREKERSCSVLASACKGMITGFGLESYRLALIALMNEV